MFSIGRVLIGLVGILPLGCAYLGLATTRKQKGRVQQAIKCFDQAIKVSPKFAPAYNNRGRAYHWKKELDRAVREFGKAIELAPGYADAYENRGKAWRDKGDEKRPRPTSQRRGN